MPVARGPNKSSRQAIAVVVAGLMGCLALAFLVTRITGQASTGDITVTVDRIFRAGQADAMSEVIAEGGPLLVSDVAGGDRDMILQHIGDDPNSGWYAFAARSGTSPRNCVVQWRPETEDFEESCDGTIYPASGDGLTQYSVEIDPDGDLSVDLNSPQS